MGEQAIAIQIKAATRCRICGRILTSPKSIADGVGCTCRKAIGMDTTNRDRAHRRRRKRRARRMAQEMYESEQLKFQW
jgi:hypothetical protein